MIIPINGQQVPNIVVTAKGGQLAPGVCARVSHFPQLVGRLLPHQSEDLQRTLTRYAELGCEVTITMEML